MGNHSFRKSEHLRISLEEDVQHEISSGLENYRFPHQALPEINLDEIQLEQTLFNKVIKLPLLISSMTGGLAAAESINRILAEAAQGYQIAMGVGSQRVAIEDPVYEKTFKIRKYAPDILLFANLGAIQLNYGYGLEECKKAIDMIEADALILHLNPLQEALQPDGNTHFKGLLTQIEKICHGIQAPVIAKEVGWGISGVSAKKLIEAGVQGIDVAGAGGTSWSQVEMYRATDPNMAEIAKAFKVWGIPTAESIQQVRALNTQIPIIASGGIKDGVEVAKSIALGACLGGIAKPFLITASKSLESTHQYIEIIRKQILICMFACGVKDIHQLQNTPLTHLSNHS